MNIYRRLRARISSFWQYCTTGVWHDTRRTFSVNLIKTINLTVSSFLNSNLQNRASSLTYNTLLAIVPALALLFAIARGFGFDSLMKTQMFQALPAQAAALNQALRFADSYLTHASQGVFVGAGLLLLLWTMISLMSNIEDTMNRIWGVVSHRTVGRRIIDYTACLMILPLLMVVSSGLSIVASSYFVDNPHFKLLTPTLEVILDIAPFVLTWLAFTGMYMLFPNTKVKWQNALVSGILAGTAFQILQYLFMTGQIYVSKYNAIYGSFALLPLMMIWLQLVWTITLVGAVLCYSSQNIFMFNFSVDSANCSYKYRLDITVAILTIIAQRFNKGFTPPSFATFTHDYNMPIKLVTQSLAVMRDTHLISVIIDDNDSEIHYYQPALNTRELTVGRVVDTLLNHGTEGFVAGFDTTFSSVTAVVNNTLSGDEGAASTPLTSLVIN